MVPQPPNAKMMSLEQIVARLKSGVPVLEGAMVGDRWEAHSDNQLRVDVFRKSGFPGISVTWEYFDSMSHKHQHGKNSVLTSQINSLVAQIHAASMEAVPGRFIQSIEEDRAQAQAQDPALLEASRIQQEPEPLDPVITDWQREQMARDEEEQFLDEQQAALDAEMERATDPLLATVPEVPNALQEIPDDEYSDVDEETDPSDE
jgi:hypothetical protein